MGNGYSKLQKQLQDMNSNLEKEREKQRGDIINLKERLDEEKDARKKATEDFMKINKETQETFLNGFKIMAADIAEQSRENTAAIRLLLQQREASSSKDERYDMDRIDGFVGKCLVINNEEFQKSPTRNGTGRDAGTLKSLFGKFGFQVKEEKNLTKDRMVAALEKLSERDNSKMRCCVVIVLSHGSQGGVTGVDGGVLNVADIWHPFTTGGRWRGKPKIFIIQACQGTRHMQPNSTSGFEYDAVPERENFPAKPPTHSDILLCCATVTGFTCAREPDGAGSVYIRAFADIINNNYLQKDLESMLTMVHRKVTERKSLVQQPYTSSTLRKKVYFAEEEKEDNPW